MCAELGSSRKCNIISSHLIYKVKLLDDDALQMKSHIATHENKDALRLDLNTDSATCPPKGILIVLSIAKIKRWKMMKIDFKSAFLQTGKALRDVYVILPYESSDRYLFNWLLMAASYSLDNANDKWQEHSDGFLQHIGFQQLLYVPHLFYMKRDGELIALAVKIFDDVLLAGQTNLVEKTVASIESQYELRTDVRSALQFLFFGL